MPQPDKPTEFSEWFEAQFGPRPYGPASDGKLIKEFRVADSEYTRTKTRLGVRRDWNRLRDAAYKAWLASTDKKES